MDSGKKPEYMIYRRNSIIVASVVLAIFLIAFITTFSYGRTPARMPRFISGIGIAVVVIELITQISNYKKEPQKGESLDKVVGVPWYYVFFSIAVYILLMYLVGFIVSNLILLFVLPIIIGTPEGKGLNKWKNYLVFAVILTAMLYLSFSYIFLIRLPKGVLFELIGGVR